MAQLSGFLMNNMSKEKPINAVILDMDGVIWRSFTPIGDIPWVFNRFQQLGLKYALATNNSTKTVSTYVRKLAEIGVTVPEERVFTSPVSMAFLLKEKYPQGGPVYILGEDGLRQSLADQGFYHQEDNVLAVVCGLDREFNFAKLTQITLLIRSGKPFYMTNPDRTFPTTRGLEPGAGTILAAIETATDVKPILAGKPSPVMIQTVMQQIGAEPETTLVVGDRLETDIMSGQAAGCQTALVLSGVTTREQGEEWRPKIDYISESLETLVKELFD
jgi:4-nitrophenyl phosphatase